MTTMLRTGTGTSATATARHHRQLHVAATHHAAAAAAAHRRPSALLLRGGAPSPLATPRHRPQNRPLTLRPPAASASGPSTRREIPIFPLGVVALPHATVPLMIFEPRYRVLFSTLLGAGEEGVEEGLVQTESPYCGTRTFGLCYCAQDGRMAAVGTELKIEQHLHEQDGRIYVTSKGTERFRVTRVVKERPVLICEVETLPEDSDGSADKNDPAISQRAKELAAEVAETLRSTLRLHLKMSSASARRSGRGGGRGPGATGGGAAQPGVAGAEAAAAAAAARQEQQQQQGGAAGGEGAVSGAGAATSSGPLEEDPLEPEELTELAPGPLSYWVAHVLGDARALQQSLLEAEGTCERLEREKEVLESTLKFYSAATALESVFGATGGGAPGSEAGAVPPPGGPD
jgi:Lon protease-like protein